MLWGQGVGRSETKENEAKQKEESVGRNGKKMQLHSSLLTAEHPGSRATREQKLTMWEGLILLDDDQVMRFSIITGLAAFFFKHSKGLTESPKALPADSSYLPSLTSLPTHAQVLLPIFSRI